MILFIFILSIAVFWYSRMFSFDQSFSYFFPLASLALIVSFAPLYGHVKNVLGEVPGLTFFVLSLLALYIL